MIAVLSAINGMPGVLTLIIGLALGWFLGGRYADNWRGWHDGWAAFHRARRRTHSDDED